MAFICLVLLLITTILSKCMAAGITTTTRVIQVTVHPPVLITSHKSGTSSHTTATTSTSRTATTSDSSITSSSTTSTTASNALSSDVCTYTASPAASCISDPPKALSDCSERTVILGATLGAILGLIAIVELAGIIFLRGRLARANRIVSDQGDVLKRMAGRWNG